MFNSSKYSINPLTLALSRSGRGDGDAPPDDEGASYEPFKPANGSGNRDLRRGAGGGGRGDEAEDGDVRAEDLGAAGVREAAQATYERGAGQANVFRRIRRGSHGNGAHRGGMEKKRAAQIRIAPGKKERPAIFMKEEKSAQYSG